MTKSLAGTLLIIFLLIRIGLSSLLVSINPYLPYGTELLFSLLAFTFATNKWKWSWDAGQRPGLEIMGAWIAGLILRLVLKQTGILVPFDIHYDITLFLLVLVGPILEEFLFRGGLWLCLESFLSSKMAWITTSILFALSHLSAWNDVPADYHPFVLIQTGYTLAIGLWWGMRFRQTRSPALPVLLHIGFNAGFAIGSIW